MGRGTPQNHIEINRKGVVYIEPNGWTHESSSSLLRDLTAKR
jgi:hypothetical protein